MKRQFRLIPLIVIAGTLLVAGCSTTRSNSNARSQRQEAQNEASLEKRALAHAHYAAAVIHDLNDESDEALQEYWEAAVNDPDDDSLTLEVSRRLMLGKQPERAFELLQSASKRRGASGDIFARLALVCLQLGKNDQAVDAGRTAIEKSPDSLAGYQNLFQNFLLINRPDDALKTLNEAAKRPDTSVYFLTGLAELYANFVLQFPARRAEVEPRAQAVLDRAARFEDAPIQLQLRQADIYGNVGEAEKAASIYEKTLDQLKDVPFLHGSILAKLVGIYLQAHDNKKAEAQLDRLLETDPSNAEAYDLLGKIAYEEGKWEDAAGYFQKCVLFNPSNEEAYYNRARALLAAGQGSEALVTLDTARTKFRQSFLMEYLFAIAYAQTKAYPEAVQHLTAAEIVAKATNTNLLTEDFYFQAGTVFERGHDYDQAANYFQKAIAIAPDFAEALNYLGYMWADRGEHLEEARSLIDRALKIEPDSAAFVDSLGWVLFKQGQLQPALKQILRAVELSKEPDPELYNHLGDIYAALNELDKARDAWRKSLSVEPNETVQRKLDASMAQ